MRRDPGAVAAFRTAERSNDILLPGCPYSQNGYAGVRALTRAAQSLDRHLPAEYKFAGSQRSIV